MCENFKQSNIDFEIPIKDYQPNIGRIVDVIVNKKVLKSDTIKTPTGTSLEGQTFTGSKLIILVKFTVDIFYASVRGTVYRTRYIIPYWEHIATDSEIDNLDFFDIELEASDIYVCTLNKRRVYGNITTFTKVKKCLKGVKSGE